MNGLISLRKKIKNNLRSTFKQVVSIPSKISSAKRTLNEYKENISAYNLTNRSTKSHKYQSELSRDKNDMLGTEKDSAISINLSSTNIDLCQGIISDIENIDIKDSTSESKKFSSPTNSVNSTKLKCPKNKHHNLKEDEPCVCVNIEKLKYHMKQTIESEWHKYKVEPTSLDQLELVKKPVICVQGGQGVVFIMSHVSQRNRKFALKMKLRQTKSNSSWLIEQREVNLLKSVNHSFIVSLFHVHETSSAIFMTMEHLEGGCLWSHIAKKGTLPESYSVYYSACILDALKFLHSTGIVYRDLKAENIVLDGHGRPKLIDFGMAKQIKVSTITNFEETGDRGEEKGENVEVEHATQYYYAGYLAPEIYTKPCTANIKIDSWGIGYIISELVLGYGVFVTMPWELPARNNSQDSVKVISASNNACPANNFTETVDKWETWPAKLERETDPLLCTAGGPISAVCRDLLSRTLVYNSSNRITLDVMVQHPFYWSIPNWSILPYIKPPDLSCFLLRANNVMTSSIKAVSTLENSNNDFIWSTSLYNSNKTAPTPEFTPSLLSKDADKSKCRTIIRCKKSTNNNFTVATPQDTPLNPKAPNIKLYNYPNVIKNKKKDPKTIYREYKANLNANLLKKQNWDSNKTTIDTISNLKPNWKY